jgi:hypothetical protein
MTIAEDSCNAETGSGNYAQGAIHSPHTQKRWHISFRPTQQPAAWVTVK